MMEWLPWRRRRRRWRWRRRGGIGRRSWTMMMRRRRTGRRRMTMVMRRRRRRRMMMTTCLWTMWRLRRSSLLLATMTMTTTTTTTAATAINQPTAMLISIADDLAADLTALLPSLSSDFMTQFCQVAVDHVTKGSLSSSRYAQVAKSVDGEVAQVKTALAALSSLFIQCAKRNVGEADVRKALEELEGMEKHAAQVAECYGRQKARLRAVLAGEFAMRLPHYVDLDWRIDVEVGSRALRNQVKPTMMLNLKTTEKDTLLQADYAVAKHVCDELEQAMKQANTAHSRRIIKYIR
eukprot:TRINITY_DN67334_c7_g5_i1.p1 TRINITY_DN67334_c7_g5~~TRINITY_DN67334_c7_g5_i1.p1  ORF type:complete len:293 (+),score=98.09 TRINITY_DN67334_c7_g5_i1:104-982(+)